MSSWQMAELYSKRNNMEALKLFKTISIAILCTITGFTLMSHVDHDARITNQSGFTVTSPTAKPASSKPKTVKQSSKAKSNPVKPTTHPTHARPIQKQQQVTLQFTDAELIQNQGIGDEWSTWIEIDGKRLYRGDRINVRVNGSINITVHILESDPTHDDYNYKSYRISQSDLSSRRDLSYDVSVTERHGRGAGGTATWRFHIASESI